MDMRKAEEINTIGACFRKRVEETPKEPAIEYGGRFLTWEELDCMSDWLMKRFWSMGMRKGSHAAIFGSNSLEWVAVFLGLTKLGAMAILMNPGFQDMELKRILRYADVEYLFYGETFKGRSLEQVIAQIHPVEVPKLKQTIPIELPDAIRMKEEGTRSLTKEEREMLKEQKNQVRQEEVAAMLFTSGTTSEPKGVLLTHRNLVLDAKASVAAMHWTAKDQVCVTVPLFHCFGITSCLLGGIIAGSCMHLQKDYHSVTVAETIEKWHCTVLSGVPTMFLALLHNKKRADYDLSSLESGIIAGSTIGTEEYIEICETFGMKHLQMSYGQTETSPGVTFSRYEDSIEEKSDNAGVPIPGIEMKIADGKAEGEILVKGFPVMQEYYKKPEETKKTIDEKGWLHTGDIGFFDEKGNLHVVGRMKEMIIRGGENIAPKEIEECIQALEEVEEVKVVGVPARVLQEEIAACVITKPGTHLDEERIRKQVRDHLAEYKVPKYVLQMEGFPVTTSGKICLKDLKIKVEAVIGG